MINKSEIKKLLKEAVEEALQEIDYSVTRDPTKLYGGQTVGTKEKPSEASYQYGSEFAKATVKKIEELKEVVYSPMFEIVTSYKGHPKFIKLHDEIERSGINTPAANTILDLEQILVKISNDLLKFRKAMPHNTGDLYFLGQNQGQDVTKINELEWRQKFAEMQKFVLPLIQNHQKLMEKSVNLKNLYSELTTSNQKFSDLSSGTMELQEWVEKVNSIIVRMNLTKETFPKIYNLLNSQKKNVKLNVVK